MDDTLTEDDILAEWLDPRRVALWEAVNEYAVACGGDTSNRTTTGRRMRAVAQVERAVRAYTHPVGPDGNRVLPVGRDDGLGWARGLLWAVAIYAAVGSFLYLWWIN